MTDTSRRPVAQRRDDVDTSHRTRSNVKPMMTMTNEVTNIVEINRDDQTSN
jgi:hypothetical protein